MRIKVNRTVLFFILTLLIPVTFFCLYNWYENDVDDLPYFNAGLPVERKVGKISQIGGFDFVSQDSLPLNESFVKQKIWVVHYFFVSCPTICPVMIANMKLVQRAYKSAGDVRMISLTVDPKHDDVNALKKYTLAKHINTRQWQIGTGEKKALYSFARKDLNMIANDGNGGDNDFIHSDRLVLIDKDRYIRGYYNGLQESEIAQLINDIERLQNQDRAR
jgi:protein SCO1/2